MDFKCANNGCPVGEVTIKPKDMGAGSDQDEIKQAMDDNAVACPFCDTPLEKKA